MDMTFVIDSLATLEEATRSARSELLRARFVVAGVPVPNEVVPLLPFLPLAIWACFVRHVTTAFGILAVGWLASKEILGAADPARGLLQYGAAFLIAVVMAIAAQRRAARMTALRRAVLKGENDLAAVAADLDRERLWRRASGGGERSALDDAGLLDLAQRVSNATSVRSVASR